MTLDRCDVAPTGGLARPGWTSIVVRDGRASVRCRTVGSWSGPDSAWRVTGPWRISSPEGELLAVYVPRPTDRNGREAVRC